jgi:hypothetical protein
MLQVIGSATKCVSGCKDGFFQTFNESTGEPMCLVCAKRCAKCESQTKCIKCKSDTDFLAQNSTDVQVCVENCKDPMSFNTRDKRCIRCELYLPGCIRCTDDQLCYPYDEKGIQDFSVCPGGDYQTNCLKCDANMGYIADKIGGCCQVGDCYACHPTNANRCLSCHLGFYLLAKEFTTSKEKDSCVTELRCKDVLKLPAHGFYPF